MNVTVGELSQRRQLGLSQEEGRLYAKLTALDVSHDDIVWLLSLRQRGAGGAHIQRIITFLEKGWPEDPSGSGALDRTLRYIGRMDEETRR